MGGFRLREPVRGQGPSCIGHRSSWVVRVGMGESGSGSRKQGRSGQAPVEGKWRREAGKKSLAGGACRPCKQAQEEGTPVGMRRKLAHVADALGKGDGGGPASKQARKPLRRPQGPRRRCRRRGRRGGSPAGHRRPAPRPACPRRRRRGRPTRQGQASRRPPRRRPPKEARPRDTQAQAPAWDRAAPGTGASGRDPRPARQASGQGRRRRRERPPCRRTARRPAP